MKSHRITSAEMTEAKSLCIDWKESGASNRYVVDEANIVLTALALTAHRMSVAPAPLAERREAILSGAVESFTADWDALVSGASRPDQKVQRRLLSAIALVGCKVRLDWCRIDDEFHIVRTG